MKSNWTRCVTNNLHQCAKQKYLESEIILKNRINRTKAPIKKTSIRMTDGYSAQCIQQACKFCNRVKLGLFAVEGTREKVRNIQKFELHIFSLSLSKKRDK